MKAYVIKDKEGEYGFAFAGDIYPDTEDADKLLYTNDITKALLYSEEDMEYCQMIGMNENYVPITICEGDLEEKYEVLKGVIHLAMDYACKDKKLYKRIQDFNVSTNRHNGDNAVYLEDAVCFLTKLSKDAKDEAKKWGEFFEKIYQEQKAKESEKDDEN